MISPEICGTSPERVEEIKRGEVNGTEHDLYE